MIDSLEAADGPRAPDLKRSKARKGGGADVLKVDRLPPHSTEAEQGVLGCALISPNDSLGVCLEKLPRAEGVFTTCGIRPSSRCWSRCMMPKPRST